MKPRTLEDRALALFRKPGALADPVLVHTATVRDASTGQPLYEFVAVSSANPNGPSRRLVLSEDGSPRDYAPETDLLTVASRPIRLAAAPMPAAAVTVQPSTNVLTLNPGDTYEEIVTVTIPRNAGASKADVYFLADTTGSMAGVLAAVAAGAGSILAALNGLGLDLMYGVGNYKDFPPASPLPFTHQLSPTGVAADVTAAIGAWSALGGGDLPEAQLLALDRLAQPAGGTIGWRSGSKRIIVWFGDAPGHDPICAALGLGAAITEASATAKLTAEGIVVLAISTSNPGLNGDPVAGATDYTAACGPAGGSTGQASRLAAATGGTFVTGIDPTTIVNTIISLVTATVSSITNVRLVPSAPIAPFVASIAPASGYGPLSGETSHVLKFEVRFRGQPCSDTVRIVNGTLDVVADGTIVAAKTVEITVPPCRPKKVCYSVKFVCGTQPAGCGCAPLQPGAYATHVSIHNYSPEPVEIRKRFIPEVLAGAVVGREPNSAAVRGEDRIKLPPHSATMDDCCRITELILGASVNSVTIGVLEIVASRDVAVTAIYTSGTSLDVQPVAGRAI